MTDQRIGQSIRASGAAVAAVLCIVSSVRHAYPINPQGRNLYKRESLPASPFRTDEL
jgi:hypothetical protein